MAGFAVHLGDVIGMGIFLDVGVAVVALQAAVNAGTELVAINGDAVAGGVLHRFVAVACEAISLRSEIAGRQQHQKREEAEGECPAMSDRFEEGVQPIGWTGNNCDQECCETCGFGHAAVFPLRGVSNCVPAHGFPAAEFPLALKPMAGIATLRRRLLQLDWQ